MVGMRQKLQERSHEIRKAIEAELLNLEVPTTVMGLTRTVKSNRITVSRMLLECIESEKFPVSMVTLGGYDIIYRKISVRNDLNDANNTKSMPEGEAQCD